MTILDCGDKPLDLSQPRIMGVLNITPDSFSDGGNFLSAQSAYDHAMAMVEAGASIIDIGGESTRPGAAEVSVDEELDRVIPVIEALRSVPAVISIDTSKPAVMSAAVSAGAGLLNDVRALQEPGALEAVAGLRVPVCLMHMQGLPRTMQQAPHYDDVVEEVHDFLLQRVESCVAAGIDRRRILVDPGFGFGKSLQHNLTLLAQLNRFTEMGLPLLVGMSRKSMLGTIVDKPVDERLYASLAVASLAAWQGADIIRVHEVAESVDVIKVVTAVMENRHNSQNQRARE
ncbi:MAG: dihydropteroate synthase [Gammaproteobacteria bacterium]|nr:dihydropteroate synthase [Gammaproteobacteria bacterium]